MSGGPCSRLELYHAAGLAAGLVDRLLDVSAGVLPSSTRSPHGANKSLSPLYHTPRHPSTILPTVVFPTIRGEAVSPLCSTHIFMRAPFKNTTTSPGGGIAQSSTLNAAIGVLRDEACGCQRLACVPVWCSLLASRAAPRCWLGRWPSRSPSRRVCWGIAFFYSIASWRSVELHAPRTRVADRTSAERLFLLLQQISLSLSPLYHTPRHPSMTSRMFGRSDMTLPNSIC
ncbi:hypothetical protein Aperf_G00000051323 [Anoplocephala perfoliata]